MKYDLIVVGGGASGIFCAINFAQLLGAKANILVLEKSPNFLTKVKISGGGRCNVTHAQFDRKIFCQNYPRGEKALISPMQNFSAQDTIDWFKLRGVQLVKEADGRMFPSSNKSEEIIQCFFTECHKYNITLLPKNPVTAIKALAPETHGFQVCTKERTYETTQLLIATGSSSQGYKLAQGLGHTITPLAPSLFSFKINTQLLQGLAGISFENVYVKLQVDGKRFEQEGALLITHHGLSGPAILKLSAWAAREMKQQNYQAKIQVNWLGKVKEAEVSKMLEQHFQSAGTKLIKNSPPPGLTRNFWGNLLKTNDIDDSRSCHGLSSKAFHRLVQAISASQLEVQGQNRFKEEFVECGGVKLSEIDLKSMQSKIHRGLFFTGEILDIDGVTGGFNFQNAWTGGYLSAQHMVKNAASSKL